MKETYRDIEIEYNEPNNNWEFTLRGRERTASSLKLAKEAIDKPVPASEKEKFEPVKGWLIPYCNAEPEQVTVTSVAQRYGSNHVRVRRASRTGATLEHADRFYPLNEHNALVVDEIKQITKEIGALAKKREAVQTKLRKYKFPDVQ